MYELFDAASDAIIAYNKNKTEENKKVANNALRTLEKVLIPNGMDKMTITIVLKDLIGEKLLKTE